MSSSSGLNLNSDPSLLNKIAPDSNRQSSQSVPSALAALKQLEKDLIEAKCLNFLHIFKISMTRIEKGRSDVEDVSRSMVGIYTDMLEYHEKGKRNSVEELQELKCLYSFVAKIDPDQFPFPSHLLAADAFAMANFEKELAELQRLVGHICGGWFVKDSAIEGMGAIEPLTYLCKYLQDHSNGWEGQADFINKLQQAIEIAKQLPQENGVAFLFDAIEKAFATSVSVIIPGGWIGSKDKPGHAMYYEVIPTSATEATFRLYNLGAGSNEHFRALIGNKYKTHPFIDWQQIARTDLLNEANLRALIEIKTCSTAKDNASTSYSESDVYMGLKSLFNPKSVYGMQDMAVVPALLMTQQQAGICTWRSLMACLRTHMPQDVSFYKHLKNDIKIQVLHEVMEKQSASSSKDVSPETYRLIAKSHKNLALSVDRFYQRPAPVKWVERLQVGAKWVQNQPILLPAKKAPVLNYDPNVKHVVTLKTPAFAVAAPGSHALVPHSLLVPKFKNFLNPPAAELASTLKEVNQLAGHFWLKEDAALQLSLIAFISSLRMDEKFLKEACSDPQQLTAQNLIELLGQTATMFYKNSNTFSEVIHPEQIYCFMKLMKMQQRLFRLGIPNGERFIFNWPKHVQEMMSYHNHYVSMLNIQQAKEMHLILVECKKEESSSYSAKSHEKINAGYSNDSSARKKYKGPIIEFPEMKAEFFSYYMEKIDPKKHMEIIKQADMVEKPTEQQQACVYVSDDLLPWLKALRNTDLLLKYFLEEPYERKRQLIKDDLKLQLIFDPKIETPPGRSKKMVHVIIRLSGIEGGNDRLKPIHKEIYRAIQNPLIQSVLAEQWHSKGTEKKILSDGVKSSEEKKELLALIHYNGLRLINTLSYFKKYPEKLRDPDYQILFQQLIFQAGQLPEVNFESPYDLGQSLQNFLQKQYELCARSNQIQSAAFFLQMLRRITPYAKDNLESHLQKVRTLLERPGLELVEKSLLYAELGAHFLNKKTLEEIEITELLVAYTHMQLYPVVPSWREVETEKELRQTIHQHAILIQEWLMPEGVARSDRLNKVLAHLYPQKMGNWQVEKKDGYAPRFYTTDNKYQFFPLEGHLISDGLRALPFDILQHSTFKALFPDTKLASYHDDYYYLSDATGTEVRVQWRNGKYSPERLLAIEKKLEGQNWYIFQEGDFISIADSCDSYNKVIKSVFTSRFFLRQCDVYIIPSEQEEITIFLVDKVNNQRLYQVKATQTSLTENRTNSIERMRDQAFLSKPSAIFDTFEDPSYVQQWHDQNKRLKEIELPRFNLSFTYKEKKLVCDQHPGYFLELEETVKELLAYSRYLLLRNEAGQKKVLIANQRFKKPGKVDSLKAVFDIDQELGVQETAPQTYFSYDIDQKGRLHSYSLAAKCYLAHIFLLTQCYDRAALLLRRYGEKLTPYTSEENKILKAMLENASQDADGNAAAIRLYAGYLILKNQSIYQVTSKPVIGIADYESYLSSHKKITALTLTVSEEQFLLRFMKDSPLLDERRNQLYALASKKEYPANSLMMHYEMTLPTELPRLLSLPLSTPINWKLLLLTRAEFIPNANKGQDFWRYYAVAREGNPSDKDALKVMCTFWKLHKTANRDNAQWANLFELVAAHPNDFPPFSVESGCGEKVLQVARARVKQRIKFSAKANSIPNRTPAQFHKAAGKPAAFILSFKFQTALDALALLTGQPLSGIKDSLALVEKQIQEVVSQLPQDDAQAHLLRWGGVHQMLTLEEVLMCFGRKDPQFLQMRNPYLNEADINLLFDKAAEYLLIATLIQKEERVLAISKKIEMAPENEREALQQDLNNERAAKRAYNPSEHYAYLTFEYFANLLMRPSQVQKLDIFLNRGDQNIVMEMIMGSGKSKLLLPLLGLLRADGKAISMMLVLPQFLSSVASDTQASLMNAFSQSLRTIHFDRETPFTVNTLESILSDLESIKENRECLIMTNKSVQCLLLRFVEEFSVHFAKPNQQGLSPELSLMQKIIKLLGQAGLPIVDEADGVFNILQELCYSLGKTTSPEPKQIELTADIYQLLYSDPELKKLGRLESDPNPNEAAPLMTQELYKAQIKRPLAQALMKERGWENPLLLEYLCHNPSKEVQSAYEQQPPEMRSLLALAAQQISEFMPHTLTQVSSVGYGLDEQSTVLALPFAAANTPSRGSQFAQIWMTINYTIQSYLKQGISRAIIEREVKRLQNQWLWETEAAQLKGIELDWEQTPSGKLFLDLVEDANFPFENIQESNWQHLIKTVNASQPKQMMLLIHSILPQVELFPQKITANPLHLAAFFKSLMAFTGTLWNANSMHNKLTAQAESDIDEKTARLLQKSLIAVGKEGTTEETLQDLAKVNYDVIIDSGGYLKREGNTTFLARKVVTINKGKSVAFYNAAGEQSITDGINEMPLSQSSLKPDQRLAVLEMRFTTGADIKYKTNAQAVMTVGRAILWRDLKQSVWRMRELDRGQTITFFLSYDVAALIRQFCNKAESDAITYADIEAFARHNEESRQKQDNLTALKESLWNIPQQILLAKMLEPSQTAEIYCSIQTFLNEIWIKKEENDPDKMYGQLSVACQSIDLFTEEGGEVARCEDLLKRMYATFKDAEAQNKASLSMNEIKGRIAKFWTEGLLPQEIVKPESNKNMVMETLTERQTQVQQEMAVEKIDSKVAGLTRLGNIERGLLTDWEQKMESPFVCRSGELPYFSIQKYFEQKPAFQAYKDGFEGIKMTTNILNWADDKKAVSMQEADFFFPHRNLQHLLINEKEEIILLSEDDIQNSNWRDNNSRYYESKDYYHLNLGFCHRTDRKISPRLLAKIVKVKFLNGESRYSEEEIAQLKLWLAEHGAAKMRQLYEYALAASSAKRAAYNGKSVLKTLFQSLA
jgi:hypothetical protein